MKFPQKGFLLATFVLCVLFVSVFAFCYDNTFLFFSTIPKAFLSIHPVIAFVFTPAAFIVNAYLIKRFAPQLIGCGTVYVILALKKKMTEAYLGVHALWVIFLGSLICVLAGGALGREGALVQMGGGIFLWFAQQLKQKKHSVSSSEWIMAGSATAFSLVFHSPIAGLVFALENFAVFSKPFTVTRFMRVGFIIGFSILGAMLLLKMVFQVQPLFILPPLVFHWQLKSACALVMVSVIAVLLSMVILRCMKVFQNWHYALRARNLWYLLPIVGGLAIAFLNVADSHYNFGSGVLDVQSELASASAHSVMGFQDMLSRLFAIFASLVAGVMGGMIFPSLTIGAHIGSLIGHFFSLDEARVFVCAGMAAFLSLMLRAPFTAVILILETTNRFELLLPVIVVTFLAYGLRRLIRLL